MEVQEKWINNFVTLGAEVKVGKETVRPNTLTQIAIGKVASMDRGGGNNNIRLVVKVEGAKYDFSGYLNSNEPVADLLTQAQEKGVAVCVRFEKKRKKHVDPKADIGDIAKDANQAKENIVNIVAGIYNFNTQEWILTSDAVSNPSEDEASVKQEIDKSVFSTKGFFDSKEKNVQTDTDGKANHLLTMYTYASEHNFDNQLGLAPNAIRALAVHLLRAADKLQTEIYGLETANYSDYSHTKARGILFAWVRVNPITKELMAEEGGFSKWINRFLEESKEVWTWAKEEASK